MASSVQNVTWYDIRLFVLYAIEIDVLFTSLNELYNSDLQIYPMSRTATVMMGAGVIVFFGKVIR